MGVYIEISCDRCSTERGHSTYIANPAKEISEDYDELKFVAMGDGWGFHTSKGWLCPSCSAIDAMPRGKDGLIIGDTVETAVWGNAPEAA